MMPGTHFSRQRARVPIGVLIASAGVLTACGTIADIERHGLAAAAFHTAYCEAGSDTRARL